MPGARPKGVAFVTGAGSGLGRAIAHRLAADGYPVAIADIDASSAASVADAIGAEGGVATAVKCDVTDLASIQAAADEFPGAEGGISVLVNNAGFDRPGIFLHTDPADWEALIRVNLFGVLNCTHALAPRIAEAVRGGSEGRIVNIASDAGRVGSLGEAVYSAAKGGVIAFSKSMARELARERITVNAVCPGPAETPMTAAIQSTELGGKMMDKMIAMTPLRRLVLPEEVAAAVAYFASNEARFVTGQVLSLSGGLTMSG
ncbi:MAG TPA: SDR family oxidoreductase [Actinomycetota bacterium]|nr:SDR family oxidoreductase [Actinomycetota bacterium]